ncbi:MAG TPA: hypothetical protein VH000_07660, partial [Rhizomicrobium sp.]|nr:hypothetical protein [Rhizomicrobium sp.]
SESFEKAEGRLKRDVRQLERDVAASREDVEENASEYITRSIEELEESVAELYDMIADTSARSIELVEHTVQERPWTSVLAAFGAGCLVTLLATRRR